ncbi:MAG: type II secretion system protein F [Actinomyces sp.]|jgi:tight adherence protein B|nr:type II secretion system protein F [Actinomyces sp.]MCI1642129.1 type II secretion system protein F [Actinomyces sp.]MCI1662417.1 type II secretion system protein F [Actinomyces sp.]MCI1691227.1 type II secretion system protein F [Actinomyces sp.]MCI1788085.1 type II secretion system protein F [Actinomyces sp.]MCI1830478.1 type II secretion system protein F [Actinomyces sp.]
MSAVLAGLGLGTGLVLVLAVWAGLPPVSVGRPRWWLRWADQIVRSGVSGLTPWRLSALSAAMTAILFIAVLAWSGVWTVAAAIALMAMPVPAMAVAGRARARGAELRESWPEVVDFLVSGVRAGAGLPELLCELATVGPEPLRPQFAAFASEYGADGRFGPALTRLKERFADPVADRIVEALRLARDVGGSDLSVLLRDLGVLLREDARVRGELEARQSWTVNAARLGVAAPWLVLLMIASQAQAGAAYSTPEGMVVLGVGAAVSVIAYLAMKRLGALPTDRRSLR